MDLTNLNKDRKSKRKPSVDLSSMVYGKIPPQVKEMEEAVLGAILMNRDAFEIASEILKPECFYIDAHQRIYRSMMSLAQKSKPIDILTVVEELKEREELDMVSGPYYVAKLTNSVVSSANIETHCSYIHQTYVKREMIRISGEIIGMAYEDSCTSTDVVNELEKQFTELTSSNKSKKTYTRLDTNLITMMQRLEVMRHQQNHITGVPAGFRDLDRITHGWQKTDLIILAARPSVGKTALALNLARNAVKFSEDVQAVGIFSLEMSTAQLTNRLTASESGVHLEKISNGYIDEEGMRIIYTKGVQPLASAGIYIDDSAALSFFELRAIARRWKRKHNVGLIVIDYLQLMSGDSESRNSNREQEISRISRGLKGLAKELEIPVIALSQLSRAPEQRTGEKKMPQLSDLRESGAIEQDADVVMFMYRPEYYDTTSTEMGDSTKGETHIKIAKHRNGILDTIKLRADLSIQKFFNWEGDLQTPRADNNSRGGWKASEEHSDLFSS